MLYIRRLYRLSDFHVALPVVRFSSTSLNDRLFHVRSGHILGTISFEFCIVDICFTWLTFIVDLS